MDAQLDIVMKRPPVPVDLTLLPKIRHLGHALQKCAEAAAISDQALCIEVGIDNALWTRIKSSQAGIRAAGEGDPTDLLNRIMDVCGNELPLMWLNWRRGREPLPPLRESELERENRELREQLDVAHRDRDAVASFLRQAGVLPGREVA